MSKDFMRVSNLRKKVRENLEKKMENEMETVLILGFIRF